MARSGSLRSLTRRRAWSRALGIVASLLAGALLIGWSALWVTGRDPRPYPVVDPQAEVLVAGVRLPPGQLAEMYAPRLWQSPEIADPGPQAVYWEVLDDARLTVRYRIAWAWERHPQPVLDLLYGLYRSAYYGPRDLESVEIGIDRTTGAVSSIALDSPGPTAAYDSPMQPHFRGTWTRSGTTFGYELRQGDVVASRADDIQISQHPDVRVVTWNHLLTVGKTSADRPLEAPLLPLDDVTYRDEKVTRRD